MPTRTPPARLSFTVACCLVLALAGCRTRPALVGKVTTRARGVLPANAVLEVQLADVSRTDAAPVVIARRLYTPLGAAPWAFVLRADSARVLDAARTYAVQARVLVDGRPRLVNRRRFVVDAARLADTLEVVVEAVPHTVDVRDDAPELPPLVADLVARRHTMASRRGALTVGGTRVRWTAWLEEGQVRIVEEARDRGGEGTQDVLWAFDAGLPLFMSETSVQREGPATVRRELVANWPAGDGAPDVRLVVDGTRRAAAPDIAEILRARAKGLLAQVTRRR